ncbi:hypothetical protein CRUP_031699 [Coryphaenoides rupestris]|nr:hypothetical protein CRUP_031699 [Coryphaenoides rupestris]
MTSKAEAGGALQWINTHTHTHKLTLFSAHPPGWSTLMTMPAYKGPSTSHVLHSLQPTSDYRFRVCAVRQCQDAPELSGPYSPTVTLSPPRSEAQGGGAGGGGPGMAGAGLRVGSGGPESARPRRSLSDEQCAFLLLMAFAVIAILIAFIIQYFVIK